ncbi:MAG: hypothetical protein UMV23_06380, partial [Halanaerobium sp.]|nr:hypothetical protein [Halanaerobium sp.]
ISIERLSEEHGILSLPEESQLAVGDILYVIPNHACTAINMFDYLYLKGEDGAILRREIKARGRVE